MVVKDNRNRLINGNTVLVPEYEPSKHTKSDEYKKLEKSKKQKQYHSAQKKLKAKRSALANIALAFIVGITLISRYSAIYSIQKELTKVKTDISTLNNENENLKVSLLKASNMQYIEDEAINKLHMIKPDKNNVIYSDLTKDNFTQNSNETKKNVQQNLMGRIKSMLF